MIVDNFEGKKGNGYVNFDHPPSIDERWKSRVHAQFFERGLDPDYREDASTSDTLTSANSTAEAAYMRHIQYASDARANLLSEHTFIYTSDVVQMFRRLGIEVEDVDIVTLRQWGYVFAVPDHDRWLYPVFQFDRSSGLPSPYIKEVYDARLSGRITAPDEWATLSFWGEKAHALGGLAPRDLIWQESAADVLRKYISTLRTDQVR